ncbi:MAG: hypothetical protein BWX66_01697 [Deltaproteobacteria bacterium ADurb.Bin058]|nr:MAG: hypothetical protein BWX66_01697 [Deltaproteobacteria bacterium ADurb.Bin058]
MGMVFVGLLDGANSVRSWVHNIGTTTLSNNGACANGHVTVSKGWTIFDNQGFHALKIIFSFQGNFGFSLDNLCSGIPFCNVGPDHFQLLGFRRVNLVDDNNVSHQQVCHTWVVGSFMTRTKRVCNSDVEVWLVKRNVVVSTIPKDYVRFSLGCLQDCVIIHTSKNDSASLDVWFVLFTLFDGALVNNQVVHCRKALNCLSGQIAIRHWVTHNDNLQAHLL